MNLRFIQSNDKNWETVAEQISTADWGGAKHLSKQMKENELEDWEGVIYLEQNGNVVGFCSIVKEDIVENTLYTPYIATVFVFPEYRGSFLTEKLVNKAEEKLKKSNFNKVYLVTQLENFYEKLGYQEIDQAYDRFDRLMTVYEKNI